jgi:hypothetical protein
MYHFLVVRRDGYVIALNTFSLVQQWMNTSCSVVHTELLRINIKKIMSSHVHALIGKVGNEKTKTIFRIRFAVHLYVFIEIVNDKCLRILLAVFNFCTTSKEWDEFFCLYDKKKLLKLFHLLIKWTDALLRIDHLDYERGITVASKVIYEMGLAICSNNRLFKWFVACSFSDRQNSEELDNLYIEMTTVYKDRTFRHVFCF